MRVLTVVAVLFIALSASAQPGAQSGPSFGVQMGGGICNDVIRTMRDEWFDVKRLLTTERGVRKPRERDFSCVHPGYARTAMPKHVPSQMLQCFEEQGFVFCCDRSMRQCATL